ncbi:hypothetical protein MHC_01730 [Mycoplasma haemocanis str. Illinois]|uniref:Uncharacterized protein n=1 Tax=Mycoplasma haemocanis (strain Illinois) TaxID=1111676 RepID=H6N6E0_MYCHN|nr:hypothetical protein [Mycoplasma haemocanis]AEW45212.1 hypothetical protein MHC_01730 [Mycoplasma haemocanis str. Illinois]
MKTLTVSLAIGGGLGIGGAGFLAYKHLYPPKQISDHLKEEKFVLLNHSEEHKAHWTTLLGEYNKQKTHKNNIFTDVGKDLKVEELQEACRKALGESVDNEEIYSKAKKWCVVPVTLSEHLSKHQFRSLSTEDNNNSDQSIWEGKVTEHEKPDNSNRRIKDLSGVNQDKWKTIMSECKNISNKKNYENEFNSYFEKYKDWCSIKDSPKK